VKIKVIFVKHKGGAGALEAHHERTKEKYASNPDIDTAKSKNNFHIVQPETSYKRESDGRIVAAGCKTRKDSVRFVDTLIYRKPGVLQKQETGGSQGIFSSGGRFSIKEDRQRQYIHRSRTHGRKNVARASMLYANYRGRAVVGKRYNRQPCPAYKMAG